MNGIYPFVLENKTKHKWHKHLQYQNSSSFGIKILSIVIDLMGTGSSVSNREGRIVHWSIYLLVWHALQ